MYTLCSFYYGKTDQNECSSNSGKVRAVIELSKRNGRHHRVANEILVQIGLLLDTPNKNQTRENVVKGENSGVSIVYASS